MRMGDLDYMYNTKASVDQSRVEDTESTDVSKLPGKQKKWKNWWHYYKWHVICGIVLLGIIIDLVGSYLGLWTKAPDFQIAYVGKTELPADTVSALEQAFTSLASDFNGDGEIIVKVNQYITEPLPAKAGRFGMLLKQPEVCAPYVFALPLLLSYLEVIRIALFL